MIKTCFQQAVLSEDQKSQIDLLISVCQEFYNHLISADKQHYKLCGKVLQSKFIFQQCAIFKKHNPNYNLVHSHLLQDTAKRYCQARSKQFELAKIEHRKFHFPRITKRYHTLWFKELNNGCKLLSDNSVSFNGIIIKYIKTQDIQNVKYIGISRKLNKYYVYFVYDMPNIFKLFNGNIRNILNNYENCVKEPVNNTDLVGIDFGCTTFLTLSDESTVILPEKIFKLAKRIDELNKQKKQKIKNSKRLEKLKYQIAKIYGKIERIRKDFLHKVSKYLIQKYKTIILEDLDIAELVQGNFSKINKKILSAGFGNLVQYLLYKVENTGRQVFLVDPAYTSQACWFCYNIEKKQLKDRIHRCCVCGQELGRDLNSSKVIRDIWQYGIDLRELVFQGSEGTFG